MVVECDLGKSVFLIIFTWKYNSKLKHSFSIEHGFCSTGHFGQCPEMFLVITTEGAATEVGGLEARDVGHHPLGTAWLPMAKKDPAPNANSAEAEKLNIQS